MFYLETPSLKEMKSWVNFHYTTTWEISTIWLAERSGISASFEIPTCENYKPLAGSSINK